MIFSTKAKEEFNVKNVMSSTMDNFISKCADIYLGNPEWTLRKGIKTINFAEFVCKETAKLATLGINITLDGNSSRIKELQKKVSYIKRNIRKWVQDGCAYGTVIIKPNGSSIDIVYPDSFMVTEEENGNIKGIVFLEQKTSADGKEYYTRLEYHRFIKDLYVITNKCYKGESKDDIKTSVDIKDTPWSNYEAEIGISNMTSMLFGVLRMPDANRIDNKSALALPIFADALVELEDLDIAYSRYAKEIDDSKRTVLLDADRLIQQNPAAQRNNANYKIAAEQMELPDYVKVVESVNDERAQGMYQEINPTLNTETRIKGINFYLSLIGFKCGFSNGYFVFDESTGLITATQVTSDQARTIQLVNDVRTMVDACLIDVIKAVNVFEDLYGTTGHVDILDESDTPELERVIHIHFEPIYTNEEEDRSRAYQLTQSGYYPKWYYLHMYEGMDEETAKALTAEAGQKEPGLFDE